MGYIRAEGVTPTERLLGKLCDRAFLKLWSYPTVYRNQFAGDGNEGQGKELCDLLVVFGDNVLVFSDKHCAFATTDNLELDWSRWFRKAIVKSAAQIYGAERWLKTGSTRLFVDKACKTPLPVQLPQTQSMRVSRIVVAHGSRERCQKHFNDDTGSLLIDSHLRGEADHRTSPFTVGVVDPERGFVHVFDEYCIKLVIDNLDTITDFTRYLERREAFFKRFPGVVAAGEEELLAVYLKELNAAGEHDFVLPIDETATTVCLDKGFWNRYAQHPQRLAKIEANKISYSWDLLIEKFSYHILRGSQRESTTKNVKEQAQLLYWLAREPRVRRRMLAGAIIGLVKNAESQAQTAKFSARLSRIMQPSFPGDPFYIFVVLSRPTDRTDDEYRTIRFNLLKAHCQVLKLVFPQATDVIGIAVEASLQENEMTEDAIYVDLRSWGTEEDREAREIQSRLGIFTHLATSAGREYEYPLGKRRPMRQLDSVRVVSRNQKCPCGSKIRYRNCCGKLHFKKKHRESKKPQSE